ncbi:methyl-accepting chemotaxis protein [Bdellovibrio sp. SKB1291214]|uniref:HAMP domain-containing methyl-accepting chemotaxis protein n=1 Tax=Bdellovibrio sp. SKB1291214 TaxID=1732569 RepID=UPI000B517DE5|nr:methyl-accepting chemotaxis protein [Bdellovibrio sp. SKB1291214]UYL07575.1 methyl-accepting chemotaxis protein [Bdellovibrio sp. SKB1291214]
MFSARWFKGIRGKLLLLVTIPFAVIAVLYYEAGQGISALQKSLNQANLVRGPSINYTGKMAKESESLQRYVLNAVTAKSEEDTHTEITKALGSIEAFDKAMEEYEKIPHGGATAAIFGDIIKLWSQAKPTAQVAVEKLRTGNKVQAHDVLENQYRPVATEMSKKLQELSDLRLKLMLDDSNTDAALIAQTEQIVDWVGVIGLVVSVAFSAWVIHNLNSQLSAAVNALSENSSNILHASKQLYATSEQVAEGSTESAASIEETVASLEEVNSMVKVNSESGQKAAQFAEEAVRQAERGQAEIEKLIHAMAEIEGSSKQIQDIIKMIDDIAFQTNILSLNATIEAARAGEQGRGFSAVAEAVRKLSQDSVAAAQNIADLIHKSSEKIQTGSRSAYESSQVFKDINHTIHKVAQMSQEVSQASNEQALGVDQINKAMNQLDTSTQVNSAASEEVAVSAQELSSQAVGLQNVVATLEQILDGRRHEVHSDAPVSLKKSLTLARPILVKAS